MRTTGNNGVESLWINSIPNYRSGDLARNGVQPLNFQLTSSLISINPLDPLVRSLSEVKTASRCTKLLADRDSYKWCDPLLLDQILMMDRSFGEFTIDSSFVQVHDLLFLAITIHFLLNCYFDFLSICKIRNDEITRLFDKLFTFAWPKANFVFKRIIVYLILSKL